MAKKAFTVIKFSDELTAKRYVHSWELHNIVPSENSKDGFTTKVRYYSTIESLVRAVIRYSLYDLGEVDIRDVIALLEDATKNITWKIVEAMSDDYQVS